MSKWRLVADIGGTNVRFAKAAETGDLNENRSFLVADYPTFADAVQAYLGKAGQQGCSAIAIGAAGPVIGGKVKLTNAHWTIDKDDVSAAFGGLPCRIVNDLEAAAMAVPFLQPDEIRYAGPQCASDAPAERMLALNVGTGFGAASVMKMPSGDWIACPSEAGHMSLCARGIPELEALGLPLTNEDMLSGRRMLMRYREIAGQHGVAAEAENASAIFASSASNRAARRTVEIFTELLGRAAGDLALSVAAWGGVYLFGSVNRGWAEVADLQAFRNTFEAKGAMRERMAQTATAVVLKDDAALFGLSHLVMND